jgi:hypothetical protein
MDCEEDDNQISRRLVELSTPCLPYTVHIPLGKGLHAEINIVAYE